MVFFLAAVDFFFFLDLRFALFQLLPLLLFLLAKAAGTSGNMVVAVNVPTVNSAMSIARRAEKMIRISACMFAIEIPRKFFLILNSEALMRSPVLIVDRM